MLLPFATRCGAVKAKFGVQNSLWLSGKASWLTALINSPFYGLPLAMRRTGGAGRLPN